MSLVATSSFHTHSRYCDGRGSIDDVVEAALAAGLTEIGISSHAPLPFPTPWAMPVERLPEYVREGREAQRRYDGRIAVRLGLEMDYIPDARVTEFQEREIIPLGFDYYIGSVHFLGSGYPPRSYESDPERFLTILREEYEGDIRAMVEEYYRRIREMLRRPLLAFVGHLDRIKRWNKDQSFFRDDEAWYVAAVGQTLQAIAESGIPVEFNTSGWRKGSAEPYPAAWILARCRDLGIPIIVTADAHAPDQVTWGYDRAISCLDDLTITPQQSIEMAGV